MKEPPDAKRRVVSPQPHTTVASDKILTGSEATKRLGVHSQRSEAWYAMEAFGQLQWQTEPSVSESLKSSGFSIRLRGRQGRISPIPNVLTGCCEMRTQRDQPVPELRKPYPPRLISPTHQNTDADVAVARLARMLPGGSASSKINSPTPITIRAARDATARR
jgi:hypothetical protein